MSKTVEFLYDYASPWSYVAYMQLPRLIAETGCEVIYRPILLGGIFKGTDNSAPATVAAKGAYMFVDLQRVCKRHAIPFQLNSKFPVMTVPHMRGALVAQRDGYLEAYNDAMFKAMWADNQDLTDPMVMGGVVASIGVDPQAFAPALQDKEIKLKLREASDEAVARGAFGAPTFFVGDQMFFGQDRLDYVAEALG